jgi:hypothetical protein
MKTHRIETMTRNETLEETLNRVITDNGGFLRNNDIELLAESDRLRQVLVRCGCGRFICAAQDVAHFVEIIDRDATDYVRDVSLVATDRAYLGHFGAVTPQTRPQQPIPTAAEIEERLCLAIPSKRPPNIGSFREDDCGGSFDGFGVTSDADPGL